jgi:hypothetical protein
MCATRAESTAASASVGAVVCATTSEAVAAALCASS